MYNLPEEKDHAIAAAERALENLKDASADLQKAEKHCGSLFWKGNRWEVVRKAGKAKENIRKAQTNMYRFSRDDSDARQVDTAFRKIIENLDEILAPEGKYVKDSVRSGMALPDYLSNALTQIDQASWRIGYILEKLRAV